MIIIDEKKSKRIILFFFFVYMCSVMAHKRGYGFDAVFCRVTLVALAGVFLLFSLKNPEYLKTNTKSTFFKMLLFCLFYAGSILWAQNAASWSDAGIRNSMIQMLGVLFVLEAVTTNQAEAKAYLKVYLLAVAYMILWLILTTPAAAWGSERVGNAIGLNANSVGMRCANAFIISVYLAGEKGKYNKLYLLIAAAAMYVSLFSGSRKAFLILSLGFSLYWCGKTRGMKTLVRLVVAIAAIAGGIYLIMTNEGLYRVLGRRLERGFQYLMGNRQEGIDMSSREREFYREYAWSMFLKRPLLGYGGNGFIGEMRRICYTHVAYSHCNYTEILSTLGIVGFVLYYRVQGRMLVDAVRQYTVCRENDRGTVSLVLALVVTNLLSEYYMVSYYSVDKQILWGIVVLLLSKCGLEEVEQT